MEILHECESFIEDLYSLLPDFFCSENDTVLRNEERDSIEGLITEFGRFLLQVTGHRSQVTGCRSQVAGHRLQVTIKRQSVILAM